MCCFSVDDDHVLRVSPAYPGLQVQLSRDDVTWQTVDPEGERVEQGRRYFLRTKYGGIIVRSLIDGHRKSVISLDLQNLTHLYFDRFLIFIIHFTKHFT